MTRGRTLIVAIDALGDIDPSRLAPLSRALGTAPSRLRVGGGGASEPAAALTSLVAGQDPQRTGISTHEPFLPDRPAERSDWYGPAVAVPTLFDAARAAGLTTAALQWPATAGTGIDLCLPLLEDLPNFRTRWEMAERTSSPRIVAEQLVPRRAAGLSLTAVRPDALVAEIAAEAVGRERVDLLALRFTGLAAALRAAGIGSTEARTATGRLAGDLERVLDAFAAAPDDRIVVVPGRPVVATDRLVHPNAMLRERGLVSVDGPRIADFHAFVQPDGPRGVLHVRRDEGAAVHRAALDALDDLAARAGLRVRPTGIAPGAATDTIAEIDGPPGTAFGASATHRAVVPGDDPYYAGPRAVSDPAAPVTAWATGPGLPPRDEGSWAHLGRTLAAAVGVRLSVGRPAAVIP